MLNLPSCHSLASHGALRMMIDNLGVFSVRPFSHEYRSKASANELIGIFLQLHAFVHLCIGEHCVTDVFVLTATMPLRFAYVYYLWLTNVLMLLILLVNGVTIYVKLSKMGNLTLAMVIAELLSHCMM